MTLIVLKFFHYLAIIFAGGVLVGGGLIQSVFARSNQVPDKVYNRVPDKVSDEVLLVTPLMTLC